MFTKADSGSAALPHLRVEGPRRPLLDWSRGAAARRIHLFTPSNGGSAVLQVVGPGIPNGTGEVSALKNVHGTRAGKG